MTQQNDLGTSLVETFGNLNWPNRSLTDWKFVLNSQLTDGVLKELPIIKSTIAVYKTAFGG